MGSENKAFQLLADIAKRSVDNALGLPAQVEIVPTWSGVGFTLGGQHMVAPMAEVAELITLPTITLLPGVQRGLAELRKAMKVIEQDRSEGVLNVSMVPVFLQKWMMPRLTRFYRVAPEVDLRVSADSELVNFDDSDMHAAIRFGPGRWPGLHSVKLMDDWILPVCSPSYLEEHGPIEFTADLQKYRLLFAQSEIWNAWFRDIGVSEEGQRLPRLNDGLSTLLAAEQGEGIALSRWSLVARDIDYGRLVAPVPRMVRTDWSYYFVAPEHFWDMPKVAAFRDWMIEICQEFEKPPGA